MGPQPRTQGKSPLSSPPRTCCIDRVSALCAGAVKVRLNQPPSGSSTAAATHRLGGAKGQRLRALGACVGASKLVQSEGRASDDTVMEATDRAPEPDDDRAVIYLDDRRCFVREVTRPDLVVDHDVVPDAQLRQCRGCRDRAKQLPRLAWTASAMDTRWGSRSPAAIASSS